MDYNHVEPFHPGDFVSVLPHCHAAVAVYVGRSRERAGLPPLADSNPIATRLFQVKTVVHLPEDHEEHPGAVCYVMEECDRVLFMGYFFTRSPVQ